MDTAHKGKEPALILVRRRHVPEQAAVRAASAQRQADSNLLMQSMEPGPLAGFFISCARQGAPTWRCKSSTRPARGRVSQTVRVFRATGNLEEAEGKALV